MAKERHLVVLVPGFLGFKRIGSFTYFEKYNKLLRSELKKRGIRAEIAVKRPLPTSSLRDRAQDLLSAAHSLYRPGRHSKVHFIGHSTGGIDIRLALDPAIRLSKKRGVNRKNSLLRNSLRGALGARVSIAAPHRGTPLATPFYMMGLGFTSVSFNAVTRALSKGAFPFELLLNLFGNTPHARKDLERWSHTLDLSGFTPGEIGRTIKYIFSVAVDRRAIVDLTPLHLGRLAKREPDLGADGLHCYSILTIAPRPEPEKLARMKDSILDAPMYLAFTIPWMVTGFFPAHRSFPKLDPELLRELKYRGAPPTRHDSDGIVPTLSQPWGKVIGIVEGDHMDVIGHPGLIDCGKRFGKKDLASMVAKIAKCLAES